MTEIAAPGRGGRTDHNSDGQSQDENESFRSLSSTDHHRRRGSETSPRRSADVEPQNNRLHKRRPQGLLREVSSDGLSIEDDEERSSFLSCSDSDEEVMSFRTIASGNESERESTPFYFSVYDSDTDESNPDLTAFNNSIRNRTTVQIVEADRTNDSSSEDSDSNEEIEFVRNIQGVNSRSHGCESEFYTPRDESVTNRNLDENSSEYNERLINYDDGEHEEDPDVRNQRTFHAISDLADAVIHSEGGLVSSGASTEVHNMRNSTRDNRNSVCSDVEWEEEAYSVYDSDSSCVLESIYETDTSEEYNANVYDSVEDESENENEGYHSEVPSLSDGESGYQDVMSADEIDREEETAAYHRSSVLDELCHSLSDDEREEHGDMTLEDEEVAMLTESLVLEEKKIEDNEPESEACGTTFRETILQEALNTLEEENEKYRLSSTCKVCLVQEVQMVFIPCGHLATCFQCSHSLYTCPLCRRGILNKIRVYKS